MPESYEDQEVRALLLALGYDEKVVGDMITQVVWSTRAIDNMKYQLAQRSKSDATISNPDDNSPRRKRRRKTDRYLR